MAQHNVQTKSHRNTQCKHSSTGKIYNGRRTTRDAAQSVCCQIQQSVVCCNNHRVCISYNSCEVVCTGERVEPSQLPQIKFMTLPPRIDHQNRISSGTETPVGFYTRRSSTGVYVLPVTRAGHHVSSVRKIERGLITTIFL